MDALSQYIGFYREQATAIDARAAAPLNRLRPAALEALERAVLPRLDADNYENCDLAAMLAPDYGINIDSHVSLPGHRTELPAGVVACSLREAAERYPELVERYYGKAAELSNPVVALDTLLVQDGLFLYVPAGVALGTPLQLVNNLRSERPRMEVGRILVVLEEGASASVLVCDHTQEGDGGSLALRTVELILGDRARLDYYDMEESTLSTRRISALYLRQGAGSTALVEGITLHNGTTRNEYYCHFDGQEASLRLYGMAICDRTRSLSTYSRITHAVPHCHSDELFKYSASEQARCAFTGRIVVAPGAVKTAAYQACRNLLDGSEARIQARPELEIYNDDVKCSHGCAIGQLDPMQIFYMRTRGIPEAEAHLLLRQAFMADIIAPVSIPGLRERLQLLIEKRFAGSDATCSSCQQH